MGGVGDRKAREARGEFRNTFQQGIGPGETHDMSGPTMPDVLYPWPATPEQFALVGSDARDSAVGTGVRSVEVNLVDASFNSHTVIVATPGDAQGPPIVAADGTDQWIRCNGMRAVAGGSGAQAQDGTWGTIDVVGVLSTAVIARIEIGASVWGGCLYTIPRDERTRLTAARFEIFDPANNNSDVIGFLAARRPGEDIFNAEVSTSVLNASRLDKQIGLEQFWFPTGTDLVLRFEGLAGAGNDVFAAFAFQREQILGVL